MKSFFFFVTLCLAPVIFSPDCLAQEVSSSDLLNNAKQYDNKIVSYKGEVIGDVMTRGDHAWLHVNDGFISIGIWVPKILTEDIYYVGDYHKKGDIVEVSGVFHRSCKEHGGDLDIHASEIKKIASGSLVIHSVSRKKVYIGILSLVFILLFYAVEKFFRPSRKN